MAPREAPSPKQYQAALERAKRWLDSVRDAVDREDTASQWQVLVREAKGFFPIILGTDDRNEHPVDFALRYIFAPYYDGMHDVLHWLVYDWEPQGRMFGMNDYDKLVENQRSEAMARSEEIREETDREVQRRERELARKRQEKDEEEKERKAQLAEERRRKAEAAEQAKREAAAHAEALRRKEAVAEKRAAAQRLIDEASELEGSVGQAAAGARKVSTNKGKGKAKASTPSDAAEGTDTSGSSRKRKRQSKASTDGSESKRRKAKQPPKSRAVVEDDDDDPMEAQYEDEEEEIKVDDEEDENDPEATPRPKEKRQSARARFDAEDDGEDEGPKAGQIIGIETWEGDDRCTDCVTAGARCVRTTTVTHKGLPSTNVVCDRCRGRKHGCSFKGDHAAAAGKATTADGRSRAPTGTSAETAEAIAAIAARVDRMQYSVSSLHTRLDNFEPHQQRAAVFYSKVENLTDRLLHEVPKWTELRGDIDQRLWALDGKMGATNNNMFAVARETQRLYAALEQRLEESNRVNRFLVDSLSLLLGSSGVDAAQQAATNAPTIAPYVPIPAPTTSMEPYNATDDKYAVAPPRTTFRSPMDPLPPPPPPHKDLTTFEEFRNVPAPDKLPPRAFGQELTVPGPAAHPERMPTTPPRARATTVGPLGNPLAAPRPPRASTAGSMPAPLASAFDFTYTPRKLADIETQEQEDDDDVPMEEGGKMEEGPPESPDEEEGPAKKSFGWEDIPEPQEGDQMEEDEEAVAEGEAQQGDMDEEEDAEHSEPAAPPTRGGTSRGNRRGGRGRGGAPRPAVAPRTTRSRAAASRSSGGTTDDDQDDQLME